MVAPDPCHPGTPPVSFHPDSKLLALAKTTDFEADVDKVLQVVRTMLIEKNRKYGNSALKPVRVFSKASPLEQLKVRLDDKLSRLVNQQNDEDEDVELDLLGYIVLLRIAKNREFQNEPT